MEQDEKIALHEDELAGLEARPDPLYSLAIIRRAAAEIRAARARITELEALVAESREVVSMFKSVRFEDGEQLARIDLDDNRCVQFRGGEGFFGNEVFFIATLRAAALSTKLGAQG